AQVIEVQRLQSGTEPGREDLLPSFRVVQAEALLEQVRQQLPVGAGGLDHVLPARAARAVRATTGSRSRTRSSSSGRPAGSRSRPQARAASLRSTQSLLVASWCSRAMSSAPARL